MSMDIVIKGKAFLDGSLTDTAIGIKDGKIASIGKNAEREGITAETEKIILPGFIDTHVHFRDPGMTWKEDFASGTLGALHAGITCVLDMPNTDPVTDSLPALEAKGKIAGSKAYTDYGLFAAVTEHCDIESIAPKCAGFKLFMGSTTGNILVSDDRVIKKKFREISKTGRTISVHAESEGMISGREENGNEDHLANRPPEAEFDAVRRLSVYPENRINVCHVTSPDTIDIASSFGMTAEVTAHHILLECPNDSDPDYKVNPPLRQPSVRRGLMDAFLNGRIDMIGSDHAPHTREEKSKGYGEAPSGISGVETTVPLFLNMVREGSLPLRTFVRMVSERPGEVFGMNKGKIKEGYDADLVFVDMHHVKRICGSELHGISKFTVYEGYDAVFPDTVMIRGNIQIENGVFRGKRIGEDIRGRY